MKKQLARYIGLASFLAVLCSVIACDANAIAGGMCWKASEFERGALQLRLIEKSGDGEYWLDNARKSKMQVLPTRADAGQGSRKIILHLPSRATPVELDATEIMIGFFASLPDNPDPPRAYLLINATRIIAARVSGREDGAASNIDPDVQELEPKMVEPNRQMCWRMFDMTRKATERFLQENSPLLKEPEP